MRTTARRILYLGITLWTAYWLVTGWAYMQEHSIVVQQGFGADGIQMWEVFNIKMVAAHHAIRWAAGLVVAALLHRALIASPAAGAPSRRFLSRRRQAA
jgi:hypothetical protein